MVTKKIFSLLHITIIMHINAMHPKEFIPARITQISEFIHCVKIIQQQYHPHSPEYQKAIIYLIDTKTMPKIEHGKIT